MTNGPEDGVSIWGVCGEFGLGTREWRLLLSLARANGWRPLGTLAPSHEFADVTMTTNWDGRYGPADGQEMTKEDAVDLAEALEAALPDVPDWEILADKVLTPGFHDYTRYLSRPLKPGVSTNALEAFSGRNKTILRDFIKHCRDCSPFLLC